MCHRINSTRAVVASALFTVLLALISTGCSSDHNPAQPSEDRSIARLSIDPGAVVGGLRARGTLQLADPAPAGGIQVALTSSSAAAQVPEFVSVAEGSTVAEFTIGTSVTDTAVNVTVTATSGGSRRTAPLVITVGTVVTFASPPGEPIGRGASRSYGIANATFSAGVLFQFNTLRVRVEIRDPGLEFWSLEISAPRGARLVPGIYEGAVRSVSRTGLQPGLDFSVAGLGCSNLTGRIEVLNAEYGGPSNTFDENTINHFRARFEQRCPPQSLPLMGEVRVVMNPWR